MKYYVTNIDLSFDYSPNDDIYTPFYDKTMIVDVPDDEQDVEAYINQHIIEEIEVEFDTPDWAEYEIGYADFNFKVADEDLAHKKI